MLVNISWAVQAKLNFFLPACTHFSRILFLGDLLVNTRATKQDREAKRRAIAVRLRLTIAVIVDRVHLLL